MTMTFMSCISFIYFAIIFASLIDSVYSLYKVNRNRENINKYDDGYNLRTKLASGTCLVTDGPTYHANGPILTGNIGLYNIYLGYYDSDYKTPYSTNKATSTAGILEAFANGVGGSGYANILKTYTHSGQSAASQYTFKGNVFKTIPTSVTTFDDSTFDSYVLAGLTAAGITLNAQNICNVIFRGDIAYNSARNKHSWNTDWCGYHSTFDSNNAITIMGDESFVSDSRLRSGCSLQFVSTPSIKYIGNSHPLAFTSPNGNKYADSIVSVYSHEISETVTDPYASSQAYYRNCDLDENADICAWVFGNVYTSSDGTHYNLDLGVHGKYLIQTNWILRSDGDALKSGCVITNYTFATLLNEYPVYQVDTPSLLSILLGNTLLLGLGIAGIAVIAILACLLLRQCLCVRPKKVEEINLSHSRVYFNAAANQVSGAQFAQINPYTVPPTVYAARG